MSAGELPRTASCCAGAAIVETSTANRKPVCDCLIVDSVGGERLSPLSSAQRIRSDRHCFSGPIQGQMAMVGLFRRMRFIGRATLKSVSWTYHGLHGSYPPLQGVTSRLPTIREFGSISRYRRVSHNSSHMRIAENRITVLRPWHRFVPRLVVCSHQASMNRDKQTATYAH
jgi:hypothetical protein